jgi:hypothetical protein
MDDNDHLNPNWIEGFLVLNYNNLVPDFKLEGVNMTYTFKVDDVLHKCIKLKAIENEMTISEFVCRLFATYYDNYSLARA